MKIRSRLSLLLSLEVYPLIEQDIIAGGRVKKTALNLWNKYEEIQKVYPDPQKFVTDVAYLKRHIAELKSANAILREYEILNLDRTLDEIKEMVELYRLQKKRINLEHNLEMRLNKLLPSLNREIALAHELLKSISALRDKIMSKYTLPSVADSSRNYITNIHVDNRHINLENTSAKSIKRVLDVVQMILDGEISPTEIPAVSSDNPSEGKNYGSDDGEQEENDI